MNSRIRIALLGLALATATLTVGWGRFGADPSLAAAEPAAMPADLGRVPLDIATLEIDLQVDRTRASLSDVVEQFRARVAAAPNDHISRTILASTLVSLARETADLETFGEAERVIDETLVLVPDSVDAQLIKARAESARHDFVAARDRAEHILEQSPTDLAALAVRADTAFELGDVDIARGDFALLHLAAPSAATASRIARLELITGDVEGAIDSAIEALKLAQPLPLRPGDAAFYWFQLGAYLFEAGDVEGSATALERALTLDPNHPGATETLGHVRTAQGRLDESIAIYRSLLAGSPAADIHGELATVLRLNGSDEEADEQLGFGLALAERTIDAYPSERRHIAGFLVRHDPATALQLAEQDIATRRDVYAYDMLAWTLMANGRVEEADAAMTSALSLGTVDADLFFHAGVIADATGDTESAIAYLRAALNLNPAFDPIDAPLAAELLQQLDP